MGVCTENRLQSTNVGIFYGCFKSPGRERRGGEVGLEETKRGDLVGVNEAKIDGEEKREKSESGIETS